MTLPPPPPGDHPVVSVLIVNWNAGAKLAGCLASLREHPPTEPWEVIVVDNGSSDDSIEAARAVLTGLRVIENGTNRGLPAANNQAMTVAHGDALLICNPDVEFRPGAVDALLATLRRHPGAAFVIPRLLYPDGTLQTSAGDLPTLAEAVLGRQAQRFGAKGSAEGFWWDGWDHATERPIGRGHEAAYLVRRDAVAQIGLQDERFRLDWEGFDWTERARSLGWEIWFCPAAEVVHFGGASIRQVPFRWITSSHIGMYRYYAKRRPVWWRPGLAAVFGARATAKMALAVAGLASYERGHRRHQT